MLAPWKTMIIRRARRLPPTSVILIVVIVVCLAAGFVELFAGYGFVAGLTPIQVHVGAPVGVVALIVWHVLRHRRQRPARSDLSRRSLLQTASLLGGAAAGYVVLAGATQLASGTRAGTGSRPLLATGYEGRPLTAGRGSPVRLVAPLLPGLLVGQVGRVGGAARHPGVATAALSSVNWTMVNQPCSAESASPGGTCVVGSDREHVNPRRRTGRHYAA